MYIIWADAAPFGLPFRDPNDNLRKFEQMVLATISNPHKEQCKDEHYWNYIPVVQSSGYGKTRMLLELGQTSNDFLATYWCLRSPDHDGMPRSTIAAQTFLRALTNMTPLDVSGVLINVFEQATKRAMTWGEAPSEFWRRNRPQYLDRQLDNLWGPILDPSSSSSSSSIPLTSNEEGATTMTTASGKPLVLIIDEARWLLSQKIQGRSLFRFMQSAAREICHLALVFVDTVSKISNFAPTAVDVSSSRVPNAETSLIEWKIRNPVLAVCSIDLNSSAISNTGKFDADRALKLGRPLWGDYSLVERISVAEQKLAGRKVDSTEMLCAIAIMAPRVTSIRPHTGQTASELVASHLATCVGISQDRSCISAIYISEPVLAEAAARTWYQGDRLVGALQMLRSAVRQGLVNSGAAGERVFPIVACIVKDMLVRATISQQQYLLTVELPLAAWLQTLIAPLPAFDPAHLPMLERDPKISFTHFACAWDTTTTPSEWTQQHRLKQLYHRACAVIFPECQKGGDFLIPVRLENADIYGAVFVQTKNFGTDSRDPNYPASAADKLTPWAICNSACDASSFRGLYLMFGGSRPHEYEIWKPLQFTDFLDWKIAAANANEAHAKVKKQEAKGTTSKAAKKAAKVTASNEEELQQQADQAASAANAQFIGRRIACTNEQTDAKPAKVKPDRSAAKYSAMMRQHQANIEAHRKSYKSLAWDFANLAITNCNIEHVLQRCQLSNHVEVARELCHLLQTKTHVCLGLEQQQADIIATNLCGWIDPRSVVSWE